MNLASLAITRLSIFLLTGLVAFCQAPTPNSETLKSLLNEVHELRIAIQNMNVASQRVQIALSQLQMQEGVVTRASQRSDNARSRCQSMAESQQRTTGDMGRIQSALDSGKLPENQNKDFQSELSRLKSSLEAQTAEVQSCQTAETEASGQLVS